MSLSKSEPRRIEIIVMLIVCVGFLIWYWTPQFGRTINYSILLSKHWFPSLFSFLAGLF